MSKREFGIGFGILRPSIVQQLDEQGFNYDIERVDRFESDRKAINQLRFADVLIDSHADKCFGKLLKKIRVHLESCEQNRGDE